MRIFTIKQNFNPNERYNGVADKRRPRTGMLLKKTTANNYKNIYLTELLYTSNITRYYKANNYTNAECENAVALSNLL